MDRRALIAYAGRSVPRPRYYANDHSRDVLDITLVPMPVTDARLHSSTLDGAGFTLIRHRSAVSDFTDRAAVDLIAADAVFDSPGKPEWSFEGLLLAHATAHRWHWFPDMQLDEALIFKTHDSDRSRAHCVPHVAFDDAACPPHAVPRVSLEMRALALWFA